MNVDSLQKEDQGFFWGGTTFLSLPSTLEAIWLESAGLQGRGTELPGVLVFFSKKKEEGAIRVLVPNF